VEHAVKSWFMEPLPTMKGLRYMSQNAPAGVERSSHLCAAVMMCTATRSLLHPS